MKEEEFLLTGKLPHRRDQGEAAESQAKWGPRQQNTEEVAFLSP